MVSRLTFTVTGRNMVDIRERAEDEAEQRSGGANFEILSIWTEAWYDSLNKDFTYLDATVEVEYTYG